MNKWQTSIACGAALTAAFASFSVTAKVSEAEAAKLGEELTMIGAERSGNDAGTVPPWKGANAWSEKEKSYTYAEIKAMSREEQAKLLLSKFTDKPLFTITAENMDEYADQLSEGRKAMFKKFPKTYKMNVYESVRGTFYPEEIEEATKKNATRAVLVGTDSMQNAEIGFPFPIPTNGAEPIWNHKTKFRGDAIIRYNDQAIVKTDGTYNLTQVVEDVLFTYANLSGGTEDGILLYYLQTDLGSSGTRTLVHETADQAKDSRNAWLYNKGFGRLKRAPNVGYDNPSQTSDGEQFNDQVDMFNGALDRYNWKLLGKREMYVAHNSGKINDPTLKYSEILQAGHINQDLARYELQRVWVVEATLKEGQRHKLARRVFYINEDAWSIQEVDGYDGRGELWKFQEGHMITSPMVPTASAIPEIIYDLQSGRYFATAMVNEAKLNDFSAEFEPRYFRPANVAKRIR